MDESTMFQRVCRLCSNTNDLVWLFDDKLSDNMREIVKVTCGVEISRTDIVTQMVCSTCCHITIRMYQFRTKSIKNDKDLKAKCADYNIAQLTIAQNRKSEPPPKIDESLPTAAEAPPRAAVTPPIPQVTIKPVVALPTERNTGKFVHPSVKEVMKKNPNIKIPTRCLKSHIGPCITLLTGEVDEYFKERNMTDAEIAKVKAEAYELAVNPRKPKKRKTTREGRESPFTSKSSGKRVRLSTDSSDKMSVSSDDAQLPGKENLKNAVNEAPKTNNGTIRFSSIKIRPIPESDNVKESPPKPKTDKPVVEIPNESVFHNLLTSPSHQKPQLREEITLKSLLGHQGKIARLVDDDDDDDDDNDVGGPPSPVPSPTPSDEEPPPPKPPKEDKPKNSEEKTTKKPQTKKSEGKSSEPSTKENKPKKPDEKTTKKPQTKKSEGKSSEPSTKENKPKKPDEKTTKKHEMKKSEPPIIIIPDEGEPKSVIDKVDPKRIPEEDFTMFSSRPFLLPGMTEGGEPMVISDSEEDNNKDKDKEDASSGSTAVDPDGCSSTTSKNGDADKTNSTELAPKESEGSNQPDLSLVHLANKTYKLYTCRVCDSQHMSRKELKYHERKTHTKCPFCNKRFRTLANRDEHVSTTCLVNRSPVKLKHPKLALIRVEEVEEIRTRYSKAFDEFEERANEEETGETARSDGATNERTTTDTSSRKERNSERRKKESEGGREKQKRDQGVEKTAQAARAEPDEVRMNCDPQTAVAISELEKFLNYSEPVHTNDERNSTANTKTKRKLAKRGEDVICISDEESEENRNPPPDELERNVQSNERMINVVNSELLNGINIHDNDVNVLKALLLENCKRVKAMKEKSIKETKMNLQDSPILDGNSSRIKIFKNLRKFLHEYKIPIEVKYSPTVSVQYQRASPPPVTRVSGLWHNLVPQRLKPSTPPPPYSVPIKMLKQVFPHDPRKTVISNSLQEPRVNGVANVQDGNMTTTNLILSSSLATSNSPSLILSGASTLTTTSAPFTSYIVVQNAPVVPRTQGPLPVIASVQSACAPVSTVQPTFCVTSVQPTVAATSVQPTVAATTDPPTVGVRDAQPTVGATTFANVQPTVGVRTLQSTVPQTVDLTSDASTVCVPSDGVTTVRSTGGVTTQAAVEQPSLIAVAQLESITNSLMPTTEGGAGGGFNGIQAASAKDGVCSLPVQPAIRVKDLRELS